jgi:Uma2 family endonuclease
MATQPQTYTYADLLEMPEGPERHEIIGGELIVTASPRARHQRTVGELFIALSRWSKEQGGMALVGPIDVVFDDTNVLAPDVVYLGPDRLSRVEERCIRGAPTIIVEVSSPATRRTDMTRKLPLYERHLVPEYWFVDLDAERIEVYSLDGDRYGAPATFTHAEILVSRGAPGFTLSVSEVVPQ